jgi:hypothetical protein
MSLTTAKAPFGTLVAVIVNPELEPISHGQLAMFPLIDLHLAPLGGGCFDLRPIPAV